MKRPSFQFYPADWRNNAKLRRCSEAARGAWMDVLCVLHDMDEYGVCRWPLSDLARSANINLKLIKELVDKGVLKGADKNAEPYIYTPRHAGKNGEPVTLVENNGQPLWYCSRFVRDEYVRQKRGQSTRFDEENQPPKQKPNTPPKGGIGEPQGDGSTSTSSSTTDIRNSRENSNVPSVVDFPISPKGLICKALVQGGVINFNTANPKLDKLVDAGVTVEEIVETAQEIRLKSPDKLKFDYLVSVVIGRRSDAQQMTIAPKVENKAPWYITATGIEAKALELGIDPSSMTFPYLKIEVFKLAGVTDEMVRKASQDYPQNRKTA